MRSTLKDRREGKHASNIITSQFFFLVFDTRLLQTYTLYTYVMHLEIESAGVAYGVAVLVSSPQRRDVCLTVGTRRTGSSCRRLQRDKIQHNVAETGCMQRGT